MITDLVVVTMLSTKLTTCYITLTIIINTWRWFTKQTHLTKIIDVPTINHIQTSELCGPTLQFLLPKIPSLTVEIPLFVPIVLLDMLYLRKWQPVTQMFPGEQSKNYSILASNNSSDLKKGNIGEYSPDNNHQHFSQRVSWFLNVLIQYIYMRTLSYIRTSIIIVCPKRLPWQVPSIFLFKLVKQLLFTQALRAFSSAALISVVAFARSSSEPARPCAAATGTRHRSRRSWDEVGRIREIGRNWHRCRNSNICRWFPGEDHGVS